MIDQDQYIKAEDIQKGVYLIHYESDVNYRLAKNYGDNKHYIGCSTNIYRRIGQHRAGEGSKMTKAALDQGIKGKVAAVFPGDTYSIERMLTKLGASKFCPICIEEEYQLKPLPKKSKDIESRFTCPRCKAKADTKCKGPQGNKIVGGGYHIERTRAAKAVIKHINASRGRA